MADPKTDPCAKCGASRPEGPQLVRERVTGKATQYRRDAVVWCGRCRAVHAGRWRYAS